ncbi:thiamine phosphate synthase [Ahrensia sp. 13_GOM-1096m]|uniref:thiamine phosphate synthase n=1 Tax=Ahrensia sp. 13_GOM-1096m TaxID=1380380 RepID=UPI00054E354A|nr:thiamine phosphate synthase [Ahrensia sp. 13_GOM-1096m]
MTDSIENRPRLVLITPSDIGDDVLITQIQAALSGGDVASIIVPQYELDEDRYQNLLSAIVRDGQAEGVAVVSAGDTRIAGRCEVDGTHVLGGYSEVRTALKEFGHKWIVGSGGAETKHAALMMGEENPDYVFFGRFGQDTHSEPHKRNLELATWWSSVVEVPCILMGGNDLASLEMAAQTGADFVALSSAILGDGIDAKAACAQANEVLQTFVFADGED